MSDPNHPDNPNHLVLVYCCLVNSTFLRKLHGKFGAFQSSATSEGNNGKVPGGSSRGSPTQREGGLLLPIHDEAATVCAKFMQVGCFEVGSGVDGCNYQTPLICTSCNTHPLISCGWTKISDPSPKAPADSQIAQNCSRHRQLLTFSLSELAQN